MPKAGLFAGEVTEAAPADGASTLKQKGYQWMEYGYVFEARSSTYSATKGVLATQNGWGPYVDFPHPFDGKDYSNFTMSSVFKCNQKPAFGQSYSLFDLIQEVFGTGITFNRRTPADQIYIGGVVTTADDGATGNPKTLWTGDVEVTIDHPTWGFDDWYFVGVTYTSSGAGQLIVRNLDKGEQEIVSNTQDAGTVNWDADSEGQANSRCCWGCATTVFDQAGGIFQGYISQTLINNQVTDFSNPTERAKFIGDDGVIDLGENGTLPFDEVPLVYMPSGHPSTNNGNTFIGTYPDEFFIQKALFENESLPPVDP